MSYRMRGLPSQLFAHLLALAAPAAAEEEAVDATAMQQPVQPGREQEIAQLREDLEKLRGQVAQLEAEQSDATAAIEQDLSADGPELDLFGFADFKFSKYFLGDDNDWSPYLSRYSTFAIGNLNLYLAKELAPAWRTLMEVRFLYLPHGLEAYQEDGTFERIDTSAPDHADYSGGIVEPGRGLKWGGIELERAWVEYEAAPLLVIRGGQWLTPYGLWNADHGSVVQIASRRPYLVAEEIFVERQTGLDVHGATSLHGSTAIGYHLTLSNGRGPVDAYRDLDENKAVGARVELSGRWLGHLALGGSAYYGRYTDRTRSFDAAAPGGVGFDSTVRAQYDEVSLGGDLRWRWGELQVDAEVAHNQRAFTEGGRSLDPVTGQLRADDSRIGMYSLVGYRTPLFGVMPFVTVEYLRFAPNGVVDDVILASLGVNVRPTSAVALKIQGFRAVFTDAEPGGIGSDPATAVEAQVAWAF